jgi:acyl carrier protein
VITEEDRNRNVYYHQQQEFGAQIKRATSIDDFMAALDLRVTVNAVTPEKLPRVAQLTQRTNQFNFTTVRRTETEIQSLLSRGYECFTVDASDRFGDYGLVGLLIARAESDELQVDTFLLSCRALGRGVEHRMLAFLGQHASARGLHYVALNYAPTSRNSPAKQFLASVAPQTMRLPAEQTAELRWKPSFASSPNRVPKTPRTAVNAARQADYGRIARELSRPEKILEHVRRQRATLHSSEGMNEVETKLARIWSELLDRRSISATDNFFDIGGHSLLAVLLLLRIREAFGVELSIDQVYSGTLTLADLANRVEAAQLGGLDPEEYSALLSEIESMSDYEVRELLAREEAERA